ncbi:hypothetical protein HJG60_009176 [Phyllostomus discolor]|uniref:Uncharacterized protein n=1 Tax=Phyllostomus discolor TaxID=89673 RepID=A0A834DFU9_9CHIR|nr:hypothetical protein HJG60_009176 [Phyllostomus discolor]
MRGEREKFRFPNVLSARRAERRVCAHRGCWFFADCLPPRATDFSFSPSCRHGARPFRRHDAPPFRRHDARPFRRHDARHHRSSRRPPAPLPRAHGRKEGAEPPTRGVQCAPLCPTGSGVLARSTSCPRPTGWGGGRSRTRGSAEHIAAAPHRQAPHSRSGGGVAPLLGLLSPGGPRGPASRSRAEESGTRPCALKRRENGWLPLTFRLEPPVCAQRRGRPSPRLHGDGQARQRCDGGAAALLSATPAPPLVPNSCGQCKTQDLFTCLSIYPYVRLNTYVRCAVFCVSCLRARSLQCGGGGGAHCHCVGIQPLLPVLTGASA